MLDVVCIRGTSCCSSKSTSPSGHGLVGKCEVDERVEVKLERWALANEGMCRIPTAKPTTILLQQQHALILPIDGIICEAVTWPS